LVVELVIAMFVSVLLIMFENGPKAAVKRIILAVGVPVAPPV
jgi:hypothetical protein